MFFGFMLVFLGWRSKPDLACLYAEDICPYALGLYSWSSVNFITTRLVQHPTTLTALPHYHPTTPPRQNHAATAAHTFRPHHRTTPPRHHATTPRQHTAMHHPIIFHWMLQERLSVSQEGLTFLRSGVLRESTWRTKSQLVISDFGRFGVLGQKLEA